MHCFYPGRADLFFFAANSDQKIGPLKRARPASTSIAPMSPGFRRPVPLGNPTPSSLRVCNRSPRVPDSILGQSFVAFDHGDVNTRCRICLRHLHADGRNDDQQMIGCFSRKIEQRSFVIRAFCPSPNCWLLLAKIPRATDDASRFMIVHRPCTSSSEMIVSITDEPDAKAFNRSWLSNCAILRDHICHMSLARGISTSRSRCHAKCALFCFHSCLALAINALTHAAKVRTVASPSYALRAGQRRPHASPPATDKTTQILPDDQ